MELSYWYGIAIVVPPYQWGSFHWGRLCLVFIFVNEYFIETIYLAKTQPDSSTYAHEYKYFYLVIEWVLVMPEEHNNWLW